MRLAVSITLSLTCNNSRQRRRRRATGRSRVSEFRHVEAQTSPSTWACMRRRSVDATRTTSLRACVRVLPGGSDDSEQSSRWWSPVGKFRRQGCVRACALLCIQFGSETSEIRMHARTPLQSSVATSSPPASWVPSPTSESLRSKAKRSEHTRPVIEEALQGFLQEGFQFLCSQLACMLQATCSAGCSS